MSVATNTVSVAGNVWTVVVNSSWWASFINHPRIGMNYVRSKQSTRQLNFSSPHQSVGRVLVVLVSCISGTFIPTPIYHRLTKLCHNGFPPKSKVAVGGDINEGYVAFGYYQLSHWSTGITADSIQSSSSTGKGWLIGVLGWLRGLNKCYENYQAHALKELFVVEEYQI